MLSTYLAFLLHNLRFHREINYEGPFETGMANNIDARFASAETVNNNGRALLCKCSVSGKACAMFVTIFNVHLTESIQKMFLLCPELDS